MSITMSTSTWSTDLAERRRIRLDRMKDRMRKEAEKNAAKERKENKKPKGFI